MLVLMFISQDFPGMPLSYVYHNTGKWFTPLMVIVHMTVPFLIVYGVSVFGDTFQKHQKHKK